MDRQSVYTLSLFGENENVGGESNKKIQKELVDFVLEFHLENVYIYR
jgi:DNA replication licensing factor MCM5